MCTVMVGIHKTIATKKFSSTPIDGLLSFWSLRRLASLLVIDAKCQAELEMYLQKCTVLCNL